MQVEATIQQLNIILLKIRALAFSELPQATDEIIAVHIVFALLLAFIPFQLVVLVALAEFFTRRFEFRRDSTVLITRRVKEWWYGIPVVPVRFIEQDSSSL